MRDRTLFTLDMDRIILKGTVIGTGCARPDKRLEFSKILRSNVSYVEELPEMILTIINGKFAEQGINELKKIWNKDVKIVRMAWLKRLMVGLMDKNDNFLNSTLLESLNFQTRQLTLSMNLRNTSDVKYVKLGYLQIDEQGGDMGRRRSVSFRSNKL